MRRIGCIKFLMIFGLLGLGALSVQNVWASQANVVLSRALHFSAPHGPSITLAPGKYFVEPGEGSELRLIREGQKKEFILQAETLTHEQYELFSPMALTRPAKDNQYFITLLLPGGQKLEAKGSTKSLPATSSTAATVKPDYQPAVTAPQPTAETSAPTTATIGSPISIPQSTPQLQDLNYQAPSPNVPSLEPGSLPQNESTHLFVVAPDHLGHTIHEQPTLYWYLSEPTTHPIDVMLTEHGEVDVVFDMQLLPPMDAGMHHISLEDYGIRLLLDVPYQWEVKLITGSSEGVNTASGYIKRVTAPSTSIPTRRNQKSPTPDTPGLYAQSGLWYDAFWALSDLILAEPDNPDFFEQRASLLDQVGLTLLGNLDRDRIETR